MDRRSDRCPPNERFWTGVGLAERLVCAALGQGTCCKFKGFSETL